MHINNTQTNSCPQCGTSNPGKSRFCGSCGASLNQPAQAVQTNVEPSIIGQTIGHRFLVQKKIGEGGMGEVYIGMQKGIDRAVALKLLHPEYARDPNIVERFKNEAATASMLTNPNTVTIFDFGKTDAGALYIAMEYLRGTELSDEIAGLGAIEWGRACDIGQQICSSLQEAHDHNIIHRDLKPDNIMLLKRGDTTDFVKVLDFGIAKIKNRPEQAKLTAAGEIFGTPEYMSPEQINGEDLTPASDIYSLGIILYHMLTGVSPFRANSPLGVLAKNLTESPKPIPEVNSTVHVPTELRSLVMMSVSKNPLERPRSMSEIGAFLKKMAKKAKPQTIKIESSLSRAIQDRSKKIETQGKKSAATTSISSHPHSSPPIQQRVEQKRQESGVAVEIDTSDFERPSALEIQSHTGKPVQTPVEELPQETYAATPSIPTGEKDKIIRDIIQKMKRKRDFPAVSKHITELNAKVHSSQSSSRDLANVILKDYSLTGKLLKLINSPYYGQVRGRVTTVSRAVVLMGYDQVRQSALGLLMFDHFCMQSGDHSQALTNSILSSLFSGLAARHVAEDISTIKPEEAFICAMMRNLGKNLVAFYFPKKFQEIMRHMRKSGESEELASVAIMGVSFDDLAQALAKEWSLPDTIVNAMQKLPPGKLKSPRNASEHVKHVSAFANDLTYLSTHGKLESRQEDLEQLLERYSGSVKIPKKKMETLFFDLTEKLEDYSEAMGLGFNDSPLIKRVMAWSGEQVSYVPEAFASIPPEAKTVQPLKSYTPATIAKREKVEREKIVIQGINEVAAAVARHDDLNNIINMVLETSFRGLGLSHVLFCMYDQRTDSMRSRTGYGDEIDDLLKVFNFKYSRAGDLFTTSIAQGRDMFVDLEANRGYLSKLPSWYTKGLPQLPHQFIIYPVLVNSFPLGIIYGDVTDSSKKLTRKGLVHIPKLRTSLSKSLKRQAPRGRRH